MKNDFRKDKYFFGAIVLITFLAVFIPLSTKIGFLQTLALFTSFFLLMFLPGYIWSKVFFPRKINPLLRLVLSVALSVVSVPLVEFYSNFLLKIPINRMSVIVEISIFSLLGLLVFLLVRKNVRTNGN